MRYKTISILSVAAFLCLAVGAGNAATYYVNGTTGDDGTAVADNPSLPWATLIGAATSAMSPGDIIEIQDSGAYPGQGLVVESGVTLQSAEGQIASVTFPDVDGIFQPMGSNVFERIDFEGPGGTVTEPFPIDLDYILTGPLTFRNCKIHHFGDGAFIIAGTVTGVEGNEQPVTLENCEIYWNVTSFIWSYGNPTAISLLTFDNCYIHDVGRWVVRAHSGIGAGNYQCVFTDCLIVFRGFLGYPSGSGIEDDQRNVVEFFNIAPPANPHVTVQRCTIVGDFNDGSWPSAIHAAHASSRIVVQDTLFVGDMDKGVKGQEDAADDVSHNGFFITGTQYDLPGLAGPGDVTGDPLFVGGVGMDAYRLGAGSPYLGVGLTAPNIGWDQPTATPTPSGPTPTPTETPLVAGTDSWRDYR